MNLRELRISKGVKQVDFSRMFGIQIRTLHHWEAGTRVPPSYVGDRLMACLESIRDNDRLVVGYITDTRDFVLAKSKEDAISKSRIAWGNIQDKTKKTFVSGVFTLTDGEYKGLLWEIFEVLRDVY